MSIEILDFIVSVVLLLIMWAGVKYITRDDDEPPRGPFDGFQ